MASKISLPLYRGKEVKLFYITQVKTEPPSFTVFANYPAGIKDSHRRHFEKVLRNVYTFKGTPIRIYLKARQKEKKKHT
jgi:GTP-binding protein